MNIEHSDAATEQKSLTYVIVKVSTLNFEQTAFN